MRCNFSDQENFKVSPTESAQWLEYFKQIFQVHNLP